jgi:hypothetical protein
MRRGIRRVEVVTRLCALHIKRIDRDPLEATITATIIERLAVYGGGVLQLMASPDKVSDSIAAPYEKGSDVAAAVAVGI